MKQQFLMLSLAIALFASCEPKSEITEPTGDTPVTLPEFSKVDLQIAQTNNVFAFNLLREVYKNEKPHENILLSPLSATVALAMLNNGAAGITQEEIQSALGYGNISRDEMNAYFQKMLVVMKAADPKVAFEVANSIWVKNGFFVLPDFLDVNKTHYNAEIRNEDFYDPATVDKINAWCAEKTHDKITEIINEFSPNAVMFLINALYFKGVWTYQFDKDKTFETIFNNLDGAKPVVPTMNAEMEVNYFSDNRLAMAELPYGNESFSMIIALPNDDVSLESIVNELNSEQWEQSIAQMNKETIRIQLPRFKVEYEKTLNNDLMNLGMQAMFIPGVANLSQINPDEPLVVSFVKQKTLAEVNEEGTEAAAVTVIGIEYTSILPMPTFLVNRPFLYFIKEKTTGTIFFSGIMKNLS